MDVSLKIVIVDENPVGAAIIQDGLREAGYINVTHLDNTVRLLARGSARRRRSRWDR